MMTREEAIVELNVIHERLSNPKDCEDGCYSWEDGRYVEAIDMAIEALEQTQWIPCAERMPNAEGDGGAEWVETSGGEHYKCSRCGFLAPYYLSVDREPCEWLSDFCPNCGKLMWRGSE